MENKKNKENKENTESRESKESRENRENRGNRENTENKKGRTVGTGGARLSFRQYLILLVVGIVLFVALLNFREVMSIVSTLLSYLLPLFIGMCLAFAVNVPVKALENGMAYVQRKLHLKVRQTLNTYISLLLTVFGLGALITVFFVYAIPQFAVSYEEIKGNFEDWLPRIKENLKKFQTFLESYNIDAKWVQRLQESDVKDVSKWFDYVRNYFDINTQEIVHKVVNAGVSAISIVFTSIFGIVFSIYMIVGKQKLNLQTRKFVYAYFPKRFADRTLYVGNLFYRTFYSFITGQCLEAAILSVILYLAFRIFHIPYAGIISILAGIGNLIPYFGATVAFIIGCLLMLLISPLKVLVFAVIWVTAQEIEGKFIYPHLVGAYVGLPAIWTLFAAIVGAKMMGLFGILFFIPLTAVIYALIEKSVEGRLKEKELTVVAASAAEEREKERLLEEKRRKKREKMKEKKQEKIAKQADKKNRRKQN